MRKKDIPLVRWLLSMPPSRAPAINSTTTTTTPQSTSGTLNTTTKETGTIAINMSTREIDSNYYRTLDDDDDLYPPSNGFINPSSVFFFVSLFLSNLTGISLMCCFCR